jgi:two-component system competent response regulator ComA
MRLISILVVEDHPIVLKGLKMLLREIEDFNLETEKDPHNVLCRLQKDEFNVYLLDANMAITNDLELVTKIKENQPQAIVIVYTGDKICSYYSLLFDKKVNGIVSKNTPIEQLISTIRLSVQGKIVIPADFLDYINEKMNDKLVNLKLTQKEKQLLQMLIKGYPNKKIAATLNVSVRTVERYLSQLFSLLGVSSRIEAVEVAKEKQLIERSVDK